MIDLTHHRMLILNFAYLHIHPGGGYEGLIKLRPSFQRKLDFVSRTNLAELMDFADAHVPHDTRNAKGFEDWIQREPTEEETVLFDTWVSAITPMPRTVIHAPVGWEEVDTSNA